MGKNKNPNHDTAKHEQAMRPNTVYSEKGTLYIPPEIIPEGMVYCYHTEKIHNQEQEGNIRTSLMKGWRPVPASRHPELTLRGELDKIYPGRDSNDIIRNGGMILMEIDQETFDMYEQRNNRAAADQLSYVDTATTPGTGPQGMQFFNGLRPGGSNAPAKHVAVKPVN